MKIAVTGSDGMIGHLLVKKLKQQGHYVMECTKRTCNILDHDNPKKAFEGCKVVVHLAAQLDENATDLWEVNLKGTENTLEAAAANQVEQFIFISTVGVYGTRQGLKDESTEPKPETEYEKSKLAAEKKVLSYQELFHVTVIRPAIVLGNNTYWRKIIYAIGKKFPLIGEAPIVGNGKNHWQMICVEDVADAIAFCIGREECYGETFIAAEKEAMTLEETVRLARKCLGIEKPLTKIPPWIGMVAAKANKLLKFSQVFDGPYIKRMQADRWYSTKKLEAIGWKAQKSSRETLPKIISEILDRKVPQEKTAGRQKKQESRISSVKK